MSKNTITLETAQQWAARWKEAQQNGTEAPVTAFLIPGIDVTQVMNERNVLDVRAYLGIDGENTERLMIVGVDADGNDMIDESNGYFIYDFSQPCPTNCNKKAPYISR
jgi:hypothetical protein